MTSAGGEHLDRDRLKTGSVPRRARRGRRCIAATALLCAAGLGAPATVHAQGNETTTTSAGAESPTEAGSVEIGAGSTAAVTTGSSGPESAANPRLAPLPAPFDIVPPRHPFLGPGMLPIAAPALRRCDLVADAAARRRCEAPALAAADARP